MVARTEDMYFNINKNYVIDPLMDDNLEFVIDDDAFDQLIGLDKDINTGTDPTSTPISGCPTPRVLQSSLIPQGDDDSVSTFGGSIYLRQNDCKNRFNKSNNSQMSSNVSTMSTSTVTN